MFGMKEIRIYMQLGLHKIKIMFLCYMGIKEKKVNNWIDKKLNFPNLVQIKK